MWLQLSSFHNSNFRQEIRLNRKFFRVGRKHYFFFFKINVPTWLMSILERETFVSEGVCGISHLQFYWVFQKIPPPNIIFFISLDNILNLYAVVEGCVEKRLDSVVVVNPEKKIVYCLFSFAQKCCPIFECVASL